MKTRLYVLSLLLFFLYGCQAEKAVVKGDRVTGAVIGETTTSIPAGENQGESEPALIEEGRVPEPPLEPIDEERETESIINVIRSLEESYEKRDFKAWKNFLTDGYKKRYNDPESLKEEGWNATDLKTFFELLIEARKSANINALSISRVEFVNPNKALVYVMFKGEEFPEPQHTFININDRWYKGLFEEGE
jgi:hypothetical protein